MAAWFAIGDILEIECPTGVAYVSYAGRHQELGDGIWVVPRVFAKPTDDWRAVFGGVGYFIFYPAHAALGWKLVRKAGYSIDAIRPLPAKRRMAADLDEREQVTTWLIVEGNTRVARPANELDDEERQLPLAEIWNHAALIDAVTSGRTPA